MSETVLGARCTNYYTGGTFVLFFFIIITTTMYSLAFMLVRYREARGRTDSSEWQRGGLKGKDEKKRIYIHSHAGAYTKKREEIPLMTPQRSRAYIESS